MTWICCFAERKYQVLISNRENNNTGGRQKKKKKFLVSLIQDYLPFKRKF